MGEGTTYLPEWRSFSGDTVLVRAHGDGHESILARTLDGSWSDTLVSVDPIEQRRSASDPRTPLLPDHWLWSGSPVRGVALARMTAPQIHVYRDSREQLRLVWDAAQSSLSDAEVDHLVGVVGRRLGSGNRDVSAIRNQVLELMAVPDVVPVLADIEFGPHGMLLVQRLRPILEMDQRILAVFRARGFGGPEWDVFSGTGDYLGVLDFGDNVEIFRVQGDTIVGAREGPEGVQEVFLARLPRTLLDAAAAAVAGSPLATSPSPPPP